jgi:hypothetical protein
MGKMTKRPAFPPGAFRGSLQARRVSTRTIRATALFFAGARANLIEWM